MTIIIDPATLVITIPQSDCVLVRGTFYRLPTETVFRAAVNAILASEAGIVLPFAVTHNTQVTVAGVTYSRFIELVNGYSVEFTPNSQWTVELTESNNNLFDVANGVLRQNQVQVIPGNSAGLQVVVSGSGVTQQDKDDITQGVWTEAVRTLTAGEGLTEDQATQLRELYRLQGLDVLNPMTVTPTSRTSGDINLEISGDGVNTSTVKRITP